MTLHKHFKLIVLWAVGFEIQEKYHWYRDWVDAHWTPDWNDPEAEFRLKVPPKVIWEEVTIGVLFIAFLILLLGVSYA
jgi:hypothetical protein